MEEAEEKIRNKKSLKQIIKKELLIIQHDLIKSSLFFEDKQKGYSLENHFS